jgi:hypothetical protein
MLPVGTANAKCHPLTDALLCGIADSNRVVAMSPESSISPPVARNSWARVVLWLGLAIVGAIVWIWQSMTFIPGAALDKGTAFVKEIGQQASTVARAFHEQTVRQEFLSSAVTLAGTSRLQVATLQEHETFRRKEANSLAWGLISLPGIVVQADLPAEYGYYLDFTAPWEFTQKDDVVTAYPPQIEPNTPAPDISKLTFYTLEGHIWQDDKAVRDRLQSTLTAALRARAAEHIPLVREIARRQVQSFVEKWMADSFSDGRKFQVKVVFPDERPAPVVTEQTAAPKPAE